MPGVKATLQVSLSGRQDSINDVGMPGMPFDIDKTIQILEGTAAQNQANTLFLDNRSLASSATENLDMAGVLVDAFGQVVTDAEVVAIYLEAPKANTVPVDFFGAATNFFNGPLLGTTPKLRLKPGEFVLLTSLDGWGVTAGTGDIILVTNGAAASTYIVGLLGRTVAA